MSQDFWASLTENSSSQLLTAAMDTHLSGKAIGESFEGVRALSDAGRAKQALALPVEVGTRVAFVGGLGAVLTYENPPETGDMGTVVHVKSAGGNLTAHEGKVFVSWDDGRFLPVHAEHLRAAASKRDPDIWWLVAEENRILGGPFTDTIGAQAAMLRLAPETRRKTLVTIHKMLPKHLRADALSRAESKGVALKAAGRVKRQASTLRVASLGDLTSFFTKVGTDTLIHKSTRDLWALKQDASGFLIERLFDDSGEPLKG